MLSNEARWRKVRETTRGRALRRHLSIAALGHGGASRLGVQQRAGGIGGPRLLAVAQFPAAAPRDGGIMRTRVSRDPFAVEDGRDTAGAS